MYLKIHQRGVQWKQGAVICMLLCTSSLYDTTPIHCTPLPLHPPVMSAQYYIYIYIYRERERERDIYIYIYICFIQCLLADHRRASRDLCSRDHRRASRDLCSRDLRAAEATMIIIIIIMIIIIMIILILILIMIMMIDIHMTIDSIDIDTNTNLPAISEQRRTPVYVYV